VAVQVWIGEKPEHPNERRAIVALANGLDRLDGLYLILANFSVGGRNIDLVLIKQDAIFIVELKHVDGRVFGDVNGPWFVESANGERKRLNPGRKNPYNQVISYYYSLINFLNDQRANLLSPQKATSVDFRTCKRLVVLAPTIQSGSEVKVDWKVELKGLDELPAYLITERSSEIDLSEEEMLAIPKLLHCTRWNEVNALLAGVLPRWDTPDDGEAPAVAPTPTPAAEPLPTPAPAPTILSRAGHALSTWTGRLAVAMGALALVLALVLLLWMRDTPVPTIDQPGIVAVSTNTSLFAGGVGAAGVAAPESCAWSGFQPIGRRRGAEPDAWVNVGVAGAPPALEPEVVVTLEEVKFCGDQITITWKVHNNLYDDMVVVPLDSENIAVRDEDRNEYLVADAKSQPAELRVEPRTSARGTVVIDRPASLNAQTLVIKLKKLPFQEATWAVPISAGGP
jgi:hypothetical protein